MHLAAACNYNVEYYTNWWMSANETSSASQPGSPALRDCVYHNLLRKLAFTEDAKFQIAAVRVLRYKLTLCKKLDQNTIQPYYYNRALRQLQ